MRVGVIMAVPGETEAERHLGTTGKQSCRGDRLVECSLAAQTVADVAYGPENTPRSRSRETVDIQGQRPVK